MIVKELDSDELFKVLDLNKDGRVFLPELVATLSANMDVYVEGCKREADAL